MIPEELQGEVLDTSKTISTFSTSLKCLGNGNKILYYCSRTISHPLMLFPVFGISLGKQGKASITLKSSEFLSIFARK
jgi:hypothetical protein